MQVFSIFLRIKAKNLNLTMVREQKTRQKTNQGCFTCTIWTDKSRDHSLMNRGCKGIKGWLLHTRKGLTYPDYFYSAFHYTLRRKMNGYGYRHSLAKLSL